MFIAASFITATKKRQKHIQYTTTGEWINKCGISIMTIENNKALTHTETWMDPENMMASWTV